MDTIDDFSVGDQVFLVDKGTRRLLVGFKCFSYSILGANSLKPGAGT